MSNNKLCDKTTAIGVYMPQAFISYSSKDGIFADLAKMKLQEAGVQVWLDQTAIRGGEEWRKAIDEEISSSDVILVVITPQSCESPYVTYEWAFALGKGLKVIPLILEHAEIHPRLAVLHYLDFQHKKAFPWKALFQEIPADATSNDDADEASLQIIDSEEARWESDLSQADRIFAGLVSLDMTKVANDGTTREIDEILDSRITKNPDAARNLVKLFKEASDVTKGLPEDPKVKECVREFLACYFVTSGATTVRTLLLESDVRQQLFENAREDNNVYVRTQLVRALANTVQKSDRNACTAFVKDFIEDGNVLVSGFAYVFSTECDGVGMKDLQRAWEKTYQETKRRAFYGYLSDDSKRVRYVAADLAGYMNDETSNELLLTSTRDKYDYVRKCARSALARRAFTRKLRHATS